MKKLIAVFLIFFVIINGFQVFGISNNNDQIFDIVELVSISEPIIKNIDQKILLTIGNSNSYTNEPGYPILPIFSKTYYFPIGTKVENVEVDFLGSKEIIIENEIQSNPLPVTFKDGKKISYSQTSLNPDFDIYPEEPFRYYVGVGINDYEHVLFLTIKCYPIQFFKNDNKIIFYNDIEIKINYELPENVISFPDEYEMIIIAPPDFLESIQPLVDHKNSHGISTLLIDEANDISGSKYFPVQGRDCAEQMKYFIKDAIENWGVKYVLLFGGRYGGISEEIWWIPVRYSHLDDGGENSYLADLYFSDIYKYDNETGYEFEDWDSNGNGVFAEWKGFFKDEIDCYPDVYLGRLPCSRLYEVNIMVDKIINYENTVKGQDWFNKMIVVGGDSAPGDLYYEGEEENKLALEYMSDFEGVKIWTSDGSFSGPDDVKNAVNEGSGFLFFDGHGNPGIYSTHPPNDENVWITGLENIDMLDLTNKYKFPVCVVGACHNGQFNVSLSNMIRDIMKYGFKGYFLEPPFKFYHMEWIPKSWAWQLASMKNGGSIATIAFAGLDWFAVGDYDGDGIPDCTQYYSGCFNVNFFKNYGVNDYTILGQTYTQAQIDYVLLHPPMDFNLDCKTVQELTLMGDPSLQIGGY